MAITQVATAVSTATDSAIAGAELACKIRDVFGGESAHAVIVFAGALHDHPQLLAALAGISSSAGQFCTGSRSEATASALTLRSDSMHFALGVGRNAGADPAAAAAEVVSTFRGHRESFDQMPHHCAMLMTDAPAARTDQLVEELTMATGGNYRFFGGAAGDDAQFGRTCIFTGTEACTDAIVALEMRAEGQFSGFHNCTAVVAVFPS